MLDLSEKPWTFHDEDAFHSDRTNPFDELYSEICAQTLTDKQGTAPSGIVVAQCIGPQFESPHEIDALERLGASVVGRLLVPSRGWYPRQASLTCHCSVLLTGPQDGLRANPMRR